jgi:predicted Ser/Thr protein kinase
MHRPHSQSIESTARIKSRSGLQKIRSDLSPTTRIHTCYGDRHQMWWSHHQSLRHVLERKTTSANMTRRQVTPSKIKQQSTRSEKDTSIVPSFLRWNDWTYRCWSVRLAVSLWPIRSDCSPPVFCGTRNGWRCKSGNHGSCDGEGQEE